MTVRPPHHRLLALPLTGLLLLVAACGGGGASAQKPLPDRPQRVVAIGDSALELLLALGVTPVAVDDPLPDSPLAGPPEWLVAQFPDLAGLPTFDGQADLVGLRAARPDLIVAAGLPTRGREQLEGIAAILPLPGPPVDDLGVVANALHRQDQAATARLRVKDAAAALKVGSAGASVSIVAWQAAGPTTAVDNSLRHLLQQAGLTVDPGQAGPITSGGFGRLDASWIFVGADWRDENDSLSAPVDALESGLADPRWRAIPAVAAGHVTTVDGSLWFPNLVPSPTPSQQLGPLAQLLVLAQVQRALASE